MRTATSALLVLFGLSGLAGLSPAQAQGEDTGNVYAMTNGSPNEVVIYRRAADGTLSAPRRVPTGGRGQGTGIDPLGSQGALILSDDGRWLFAVNAGSHTITMFRVQGNMLEMVDRKRSRGRYPVSLAQRGDRLWVLNAGGPGRIATFRIRESGRISPLPESQRSLDGRFGNPPRFPDSPAQIGVSPDGRFLAITVKGTDEILVYPLDEEGIPDPAPAVSPSAGVFPFGFSFSEDGYLLVSEVFGQLGGGAVSSYSLTADGTAQVLSQSVPSGQSATCWLLTHGRVAYTTNTGSSTLSSYRILPDGEVRLRGAGVAARAPGAQQTDFAITPDGSFLYTLNSRTGTVGMYRLDERGRLRTLGQIGGLPANGGAQGIAAR